MGTTYVGQLRPSHGGQVYSKSIRGMSMRGFSVRGMDYHLAVLADANAFRAHARHVFQRKMHDAPFARGHRIEPKRLLRGLYALRSHLRGHPQFFKTQRAITAAIDLNLFVMLRLQTQSAKREMLESLQNFRPALQ